MNKSSVAIIGILLSLSHEIPARAADKAAPLVEAAPAQPDFTDAKQIAAAMANGAQLQQAKRYQQARSIYQAIIAAQPKGEVAAAARWEIARSYKAEGKTPLAAPFLEMILADRAESSPKLISDARDMLADARKSIADDFVKAKKYDPAIAILRRTVDDKESSAAAVRTALLAIAQDYLAMGNTADAIATYRLLLTKSEVGDKERLDDIIALTTLAPASVDELEAYIKTHPATTHTNIANAYCQSGRAHLQLKQLDKAAAAFDAALALKDISFALVRTALVGKAKLAVLNNDQAGAIAIYRDLLRRPVGATIHGSEYSSWDRLEDIESLIALAPGADVTEEVAGHMNHLSSLDRVSLSSAAPGNDVLYAMTSDPLDRGVMVRYAGYLRGTTGRATQADLDAVLAQITKGGDARPFVTSQFSKDVAKRISSNAPRGDYLKPLLNGDYQAAARVAWKHARLARDPVEHGLWINAVALAVACEDQYRGGRAAAFLKWANPDAPVTAANKRVAPDSLAEYLDDAAPAFHPTDAEFAAAASQLNKANSVALLDQENILGRVVPDNDVLVFATHSPDPVRHYMLYLWRAKGRATAAELGVVRNQAMSGGSERPFAVSAQSKQLATMISNKAPLADYVKPLLNGDYQTAARVAWKKALAAETPRAYGEWIDAVATAIRCRDQTVGVRDADFVKWTKGALKGPDGKPVKVNPELDFLGK